MNSEEYEVSTIIDAVNRGDLAHTKAILQNPVNRISIHDLQQSYRIAVERGHKEIRALLKVRLELAQLSRDDNLNIFEVSRLFDSCRVAMEEAKDKDLLLVIGNTGSGKSALINYLSGCKYESDGPNVANLISGDEVTKSRYGGGACTLVPKVISVSFQGRTVNFCDLPGFLDTRSPAWKIVAANAAHLVSQVCRHINGIAVVVPLGNFTGDRGKSLLNVAATLSTILKLNKEDVVQNSLHFIITQSDPYKITVETVLTRYVETILKTDDKQGLLQRDDLTHEETNILNMLVFMMRHRDRILISNILDDGECRQNILARMITSNKPQDKVCFNFTNFDPNQDKFRNIVLPKIAGHYLQRKKIIVEYEAELDRIDRDCAVLKETIRNNQRLLEEKRSELMAIPTSNKIDTSSLEREQEALRASTSAGQERIVILQRAAAEVRTQIQQLSVQMSKAKKPEVVEVWGDMFEHNPEYINQVKKQVKKVRCKSVTTNVTQKVPSKKAGSHKFEFNAGYPISGWEIVECVNGSFSGKHVVGVRYPIKGNQFNESFNFVRGKKTKVVVRVFAYSKDLPQNQELARGYHAQLNHYRTRIRQIEADIALHNAQIEDNQVRAAQFVGLLDKLRSDQVELVVKNMLMRERLQAEIKKIETKRVPADEKKYAYQKERLKQLLILLDELDLEITAFQELFDVVQRVSQLLGVKLGEDVVHNSKPRLVNSYSPTSPRIFKSVKPIIPDDSWYTDEMINKLLRHYFDQYPMLDVLYAMIGTNWEGHANEILAENLRDYLRRNPTIKQVIIPVNLNNMHWVLVCINFTNAELPDVFYIDPLGVKPNTEVKIALRNVFGHVAIMSQEGFLLQKNGYDCGPWIIEIARIFLENGRLPFHNEVNTVQARAEHKQILDEENLSYEQRGSY